MFELGVFYGKDKANECSGHLMVSDYRRPRPRATPQELHGGGYDVRCLALRWVGRRSPIPIPDAKRNGIKPLLNAGFKCRRW